ncbi:MAG: metal-dependent hydrolase [Dehalococcoidia bacterium]|nr:metal-dependent hydrolase [Dehalococcoidia bacterium]MDD5493723.1 metal-dependent hydrolase [Dehalococcoidia bacterium]
MAHLGIPLGLAYLIEQAVKSRQLSRSGISSRDKSNEDLREMYAQASDCSVKVSNGTTPSKAAIKQASTFPVDYRFILLGSILPDLIDKPIGSVIFTQAFNNARIFAHTLLFLFVAIVIGFVVFRIQKKLWGYCIAFGIFTHLVLDAMWLEPVTLFWPFLGFTFNQYQEMGWSFLFNLMLENLFAKPEVYISEIIGFIILAFFSMKTITEKKVQTFFRNGTL